MNIWGLMWKSCNKMDGETLHIIFDNGLPALFRTRSEARVWRDSNYGYIKTREDLRREPHGWRLPEPVKVYVLCERLKGFGNDLHHR